MSAIVDALPAVQEIEAQRAEVVAQQERHLAMVATERQRHEQALATYKAARAAALARGEIFDGEEPKPRITDAEHSNFVSGVHARLKYLDRQRVQVVAAERHNIEREARRQYDAALQEAREHVEALAKIATSVRAAQQAVTEAAAARAEVDFADPSKGRQPIAPPTPASPSTLVAAVERGLDLLRVEVPRVLGWRGEPLHRLPDRAPEPRIASRG